VKPICVPCQRFYRIKKAGYAFIEGMPKAGTHHVQAGRKEPENWEPYKLWFGDLWECPDCRAQIITGTGLNPMSEHYKPDFLEKMKRYMADQLQVNDC